VGSPTAGGAPTRKKGWRVYRYKYGIPRQLKKELKELFERMGFHVVTYWDRDVETSREFREKYIHSHEVIEAIGEVGALGRVTVGVRCEGHGVFATCLVFRVSNEEEVELMPGDDVGKLLAAIDRVSLGSEGDGE
jgi:hypothetical protein